MKLNKMFSQFAPNSTFLMPMTMIAIFLNFAWLFFSHPSKWTPTRTKMIMHSFFQGVLKMLFQQASPKMAPWIPILSTMFILILSMNTLGLLPYAFTATSHMSLTYSIGIPLWMSVNILGFYLAFNNRLSHLVPQGTPSYLIPLMMMMETISLLAQPMALGLRLAANLTAGHLLIFLLSITTWTLLKTPTIATMTLMVFFLLFLLEMGVACIQAYVFTALIKFYLSQNM